MGQTRKVTVHKVTEYVLDVGVNGSESEGELQEAALAMLTPQTPGRDVPPGLFVVLVDRALYGEVVRNDAGDTALACPKCTDLVVVVDSDADTGGLLGAYTDHVNGCEA